MGLQEEENRVLVSKPSIAGWGMNWQQCSKMIFVGLSDSFEAYYQAVRRCWRFGQTNAVDVYVVISDAEGAVKSQHRAQAERRRAHDKRAGRIHKGYSCCGNQANNQDQRNIHHDRKNGGSNMDDSLEVKQQAITERYALYNGDSCDILQGIPSDSVHYSIFLATVRKPIHLQQQRKGLGQLQNHR